MMWIPGFLGLVLAAITWFDSGPAQAQLPSVQGPLPSFPIPSVQNPIPSVQNPLPSAGDLIDRLNPKHVVDDFVSKTKSCHGALIPTAADCLPAGIEATLGAASPDAVLNVVISCALGKCDANAADAAKRKAAQKVSEALARELGGRIDDWEAQTRSCVGRWANYDEKIFPGGVTATPFPGKEKDGQRRDDPAAPVICDDHDMGLFNGLLCYAGDPRGCDAVRRSQVTDSSAKNYGSWWRSPMGINIDRRYDKSDPKTMSASMSEEQTWGVFLYIMKTNDRDAFYRWVDWIGTKNRDNLGLPRWCTDPNKSGECNFLPLECVAFEALARRFEPNNPLAALSISRRVGCDRVMAAVYGAAAGLFGTLLTAPASLPALLTSAPAAIFANPQVAKYLKDGFSDPKGAPALAPDLFARMAEKVPPPALPQKLAQLPLPGPEASLCVKDVVSKLGLPPPPIQLPNNGCVIPPPTFIRLPFVPLPPLPGFTTGYPVQTQVLVEAMVTEPGYARHKIGVKIYLLQLLGFDNAELQKAAKLISDKTPDNAFFIYLTGHDNDAAGVIARKCPQAADKPQPASRHQWVWERDEADEKAQKHGSPYDSSSYWDCIFAAKLLIRKEPAPPPVLAQMQRAQVEAVRVPFTQQCSGFSSQVLAGTQSASSEGDYQILFTGKPKTQFPQKHWFNDKTFVAPCSGWYSAEISVAGLKAPKDGLRLVNTRRYGHPILLAIPPGKQSTTAPLYLYQYEALGLVLASSKEARSISDAKLTMRWVPAAHPSAK